MADFISDEEMTKLETKAAKPEAKAAPSNDFISDDDMMKMEATQQSSAEAESPSIFRSAGEGLTAGFSGEIAGGVEALSGLAQGLATGSNNFGDEGRMAALQSFKQNYEKGQQDYDNKRKLAAEQSPISSILTELGGGAISAMASAPALAAKGAGLIAQGAIQGGLTGLGKSEEDSLSGVAKDAAVGAGLGAAFSWGLGKLFGSGNKPIVQAKDGSFDIKVGQNAKDVFKVSRETAESLSTPEAQNALRAELEAQAAGLKGAIAADFKATEALKQSGLTAKGALPSKGLDKALESAWSSIDDLKPENNEIAVKAAEGLKSRFKEINQALLTKSPTGNVNDVPLRELEKVRSELGDIIFAKKAYNNDPQAKTAATKLWGQLTDVLTKNDIDPLTKQAGDLTKALSGQRALFKAAEEVDSLPSGDWIKALANPQSGSGLKRFKEMVKPLEELAKKGQQDVVPNLSSYVSKDFNNAVMKARVSSVVLGETGSSMKVSPKQVITSLVSGYKNDAASKVGAAIGSLDQLRMLGLPV